VTGEPLMRLVGQPAGAPAVARREQGVHGAHVQSRQVSVPAWPAAPGSARDSSIARCQWAAASA
jgi:hypothetical protein